MGTTKFTFPLYKLNGFQVRERIGTWRRPGRHRGRRGAGQGGHRLGEGPSAAEGGQQHEYGKRRFMRDSWHGGLLEHNLAVVSGIDAVQHVGAGFQVQILHPIPLRA